MGSRLIVNIVSMARSSVVRRSRSRDEPRGSGYVASLSTGMSRCAHSLELALDALFMMACQSSSCASRRD